MPFTHEWVGSISNGSNRKVAKKGRVKRENGYKVFAVNVHKKPILFATSNESLFVLSLAYIIFCMYTLQSLVPG